MPGRIRVHLSPSLQVVMLSQYGKFVVAEYGPGLVDRPGEVAAVVVRRNIGVLAAVKSATRIVVEHRRHELGGVTRDLGEVSAARGLKSVRVVGQRPRVVGQHLFKVREGPTRVRGLP